MTSWWFQHRFLISRLSELIIKRPYNPLPSWCQVAVSNDGADWPSQQDAAVRLLSRQLDIDRCSQKKSNPWNSSLEYDWQYYIICLKQDSVHSCTDCMSSCLQVVETRQNSLVSVIDRIEFGGIMVEFLSNGYLRHCKDIFEEGWWNRKVLETVRQCVTQDLSRMTCYFVKIGNCLNI